MCEEQEQVKKVDIQKIIEEIENIDFTLEEKKKIDIQSELDKQKRYDLNISNNEKIDSSVDKLLLKKTDIFDLTIKVDTDKVRLKDIQKEIDSLEKNTNLCPVCNQRIDAELTRKLMDEKIEIRTEISDTLMKQTIELEEKVINNKKIDKAIEAIKAKKIEIPEKDVPFFTD